MRPAVGSSGGEGGAHSSATICATRKQSSILRRRGRGALQCTLPPRIHAQRANLIKFYSALLNHNFT